MACPSCGAAIAVSDTFCPHCQAPTPTPRLRPGAQVYAVKGVGTAAVVAAWVTAASMVAVCLSELVGRSLAVGARDDADPDRLDIALLIALLPLAPYLIALITTAVLTVIWTYRARKNLDAFPDAVTPISTGWSIAGWLVPFVNLVMPYRVVANISRESLIRSDTPGVVKLWWAVWVVYLVFDRLISQADDDTYESLPLVLADRADYQLYVEYYGEASAGSAVLAVLLLLAAFAFTKVVRQINAAQHDRISGPSPALPPMPGSTFPGHLAGPPQQQP
nr:DUF4328 domain-containing protein [Micromonospora sp. DSM 115978]